MRLTPLSAAWMYLLAATSMPAVMWVCARPPWDGLYLKPTLSGGLCDGLMTMLSAHLDRSLGLLFRLRVNMACEIAGKRVYRRGAFRD